MFNRIAAQACIISISCVLFSCAEPAHGAAITAIPVKVQRVENLPGAAATRYSGALEPALRIEMAFKVGGYVDMLGQAAAQGGKRALDKGDFVTKGTVLARVRAADYTTRRKSLPRTACFRRRSTTFSRPATSSHAAARWSCKARAY